MFITGIDMPFVFIYNGKSNLSEEKRKLFYEYKNDHI